MSQDQLEMIVNNSEWN